MRSFLAAAAGRSDLARAHQVADVLLQELVVAVEFVVFLLDSLYSVEDHEERILKCLGVHSELVPGLFPKRLNVLCRPPWAHRTIIHFVLHMMRFPRLY